MRKEKRKTSGEKRNNEEIKYERIEDERQRESKKGCEMLIITTKRSSW